MRVLMITGDKSFKPGHPRYELQKSAVDELAVVYWGKGSLWPKIPAGRFDVVTAQDPFWRGLFGWYCARRLGAKFNVQVHTNLLVHSLLRRLLAKFVLWRAQSVRVVSEKIKEQVLALGASAPVHVLPVYVDVERFRKITRRQSPQKTILWLGRFEEEKDPLLALEILKEVPGAKLVMLGNGSLENQLRAAAARFHRAAWVEFPGWQDPLPYLARADVVLSTSRHESWGASIVEALAAGVPVVAPDVGVAREAGAVVVPRERLAQAVMEAIQSGTRGELKLPLLSAHEWAEAWKKTL